MSYYYDYTNISAIEHSIKLQQAKLKLAQLEGVEYRIEDCKKAIKNKRKQLLISKAKMEVNKQLLLQDLMNGKKITAEIVKEG